MLRKNYFENWKKVFNTTDKTSRTDFWIFVLVNYFLYLFINAFLGGLAMQFFTEDNDYFLLYFLQFPIFIIPFITAGIRRMNDLAVPKYYFFIPFYNLYLLCLKGKTVAVDQPEESFALRFFLIGFGGSILVGILNLMMAFLFLDVLDIAANTNTGIGLMIAAVCSIVLSLFILLIVFLFYKGKITGRKIWFVLLIAFIITLPLILICAYLASH